ncbi:MAG: hypothetical protein F6K30_07285 [Cyanothece sp. SIO2G6]|nr:hypothetical protein [Cyanothece sp. SIO2G6]
MSYNLRSLLLTGLFGVILPLVMIVGFFIALLGIGLLPPLQSISTTGIAGLTDILSIFGSGNVMQGMLLISCVGCVVAILFDAYNLWILASPVRQASHPPSHELFN